MIYEGIFENREGRNIVVKVDTGGDSETVASGVAGLTLSNTGLNTTVHSKKFRLVKGTIFEVYPTGNILDRFVTIRMYKGFTYKFQAPTPTIASMYPYDFVATDLANKPIISEMGISTITYSYKATDDGYIYLNLNSRNYLQGIRLGYKVEELIFSDEPVNIVQNSNGLLEPLKLSSATVRIMTDTIKDNLFSGNSQAVSCEITDNQRKATLFRGYVTPSIYTQNFTAPYEELELECVSPISTLEYKKWRGEQENVLSWYQIIKICLQATGVYDGFFIHQNFSVNGGKYYLEELFIDQNAFKDGDEWLSCKDILEQFCLTFGLTIVEYEGNVYFLDYSKIYEDNKLTAYEFDEDVAQDVELGGLVYLADSLAHGDIYFTNDQQYVSFDELYGNIKVVSESKEIEDTVINWDDDDNLICLHPNVNYIEYENHDSKYYEDTNIYHYDLYRFYLLKDCIHYVFPSNFNPTTGTSGVGIGRECTWTSDADLKSSDASVVKSKMESLLRNNACCVVVKHFSYTSNRRGHGALPLKYTWDKCLFISFGLKNIEFRSDSSFDAGVTATLKNHFTAVGREVMLESRDSRTYLKLPDFNTYIQSKGSIYYMRYPFSFESDKHKDFRTIKADNGDFDKGRMFINDQHPAMYRVGLDLMDDHDQHWSTYNTYEWDSFWEARYLAVWFNDDLNMDCLKDYCYKWHDIYTGRKNYKENVIDLEGDIDIQNDNYQGTIKMTFPTPYFAHNTVAPSFAMLKDVEIKHVRAYPPEIAIDGKVPDNDSELQHTTSYFDNEEYSIDIKFSTQKYDRVLSYNSIIFNGEYLSYINDDGVYKTLEQMLIDRYYNHYKDPKLIFKCTVNDDPTGVAPYNIIVSNYLQKSFAVDEIDYDVLHNQRTVTLIEQ